MKYIHLFALCLTFFIIYDSSAQTIESKKVLGSYSYSQNGVSLNYGDMVDVMEPVPSAQKLMKKARSHNIFATIFGALGGFGVGYTLGAAIGGGEPIWAIAGVGAGCIGISIPFVFQQITNHRRLSQSTITHLIQMPYIIRKCI